MDEVSSQVRLALLSIGKAAP